ncbi:uncharacterized protein CDAR_254561 [Caerostris darwini]|uniref:Uncharacterized protein n=1 Tax=Caerostris darwini TaxID=1538125 RepID=A0AAV4NA39_9ARAC|nr:uncharacterized protein CDAR_254561 [Caerostris darwini]
MVLPIVLVILLPSVFFLNTHAEKLVVCEDGLLPCDDGQCIRREDWCDDATTCEDGSDEKNCGAKLFWGLGNPNKCKEKIHFQCDDGRCWPIAARCDGSEDCRDGDSGKKESNENGSKEKENTEENGSEEKEKTEENGSEEKEDESEESSEENGSEEKKEDKQESSEEKRSEEKKEESEYSYKDNFSDETETTTEADVLTTDSFDYEYSEPPATEIPITTDLEDIFSLGFWPESSPKTSKPENDFYSKKEQKARVDNYTTPAIPQISVSPTSVYRPSYVRPTTRSYINEFATRRPTIAYTSSKRYSTPRSYRRYMGGAYYSPTSAPHRNSYPSYPNQYGRSHPNHIYSQPVPNHHPYYPNANSHNGGAGWRANINRPPTIFNRRLQVPSRFYFKKNYAQIYGNDNGLSVSRGQKWILSVRNASGGWDKETPRALIALSLVNNSFLAGNHDNDLMQKYFQVYLGVNLLRDSPPTLNRLAMFVNALVATCQNPRDFQGLDLTEVIRSSILTSNRRSRRTVINPLVYLSLCLADRNLTHFEVHHLMTYLMDSRNDEVTRDMMYLALEAYTCHIQKESNPTQLYNLQKVAWNATARIIRRMKEDGSFGSIRSTALAAQALMSVNDSMEWDPRATFRFLKNHQLRSGSFGDFVSTYYALPALSGRSLLHLRNTRCNPPRVDRDLSPLEILQLPGPKNYIRYSLHIGSPLANADTMRVLVPYGISFFDIMRVAEYENEHFKCLDYKINLMKKFCLPKSVFQIPYMFLKVLLRRKRRKINIYSISDIPNDSEQGFAWHLYLRPHSDEGNTPNIQQRHTGHIKEFLPTPDQHVIYWYHSTGSV